MKNKNKLQNNQFMTRLCEYVDCALDDTRRHSYGLCYATFSKNILKQFKRIMGTFCETTPFVWADVNQSLVDKFIAYLEHEGYCKNTIQRYIRAFHAFMVYSENIGWHSNSKAKNFIRYAPVKDDEMKCRIYLSKEEIQALHDMELAGLEDIVRDVFLIGCLTGLRYSDLIRIKEPYIGRTENGTPVIRLIQKKTKSPVIIPILDGRLMSLLRKYSFNVPVVREATINKSIKLLLERLSHSVPSLARKEVTILTLPEKRKEAVARKRGESVVEYDGRGLPVKARWEMTSLHTARRSFITNMYLSQKFSVEFMMRLSGHTKYDTFKKYVRLSLDEYADDIAKNAVDCLF